MSYRPTRLVLSGVLCVFLTGCATPSVVQQCPPIPVVLTEPCDLQEPKLETNADLALAYLDALQCISATHDKLRAIRDIASCRAK